MWDEKGKIHMDKVIDIKNYLSSEKYTTRKELVEKTGLTDREVRKKISELKLRRVVLYSCQKSGYRLAKAIDKMTDEELESELEEVRHSLNDCKSRTQKLNKQKRKYIAYLKKAEQIMLERNQNHIPRIDWNGRTKKCLMYLNLETEKNQKSM